MSGGIGRIEGLLQSRLAQAVIAFALSGVAAAALTHSSGRTPLTLAVLAVGGIALLRWPAMALLALLIICQELDPAQGFGGPSASGLLFLGHQVYFDTISRTSVLTLIAAAAAAWMLVVTVPAHPRPTGPALAGALGAYVVARVWADGSAITSAINQNALFALLFGFGFVVGCRAEQSPGFRRHALPGLAATLVLMALVGLYLDATGQGQAQTGTSVIFYDSAMGAIAGAALLAGLTMERARRGRLVWLIVGASLIIVVLASRRNVWAAIAGALLLTLLVSRRRGKLISRVLIGFGVLLIAALFLAPSITAQLGHQLSAIWDATQGSAADASVKGHLSDISVGWHAIEASPLNGVGPSGHLVGLVVEGGGQLYVHNQLLETWLRFGLVGAVLIVALQVVLALQGLRVVREPASDFFERWGAMLLLMAPIAMLTAPFFTQTERWPAAIGLAAGLVATGLARRARGEEPATSLA